MTKTITTLFIRRRQLSLTRITLMAKQIEAREREKKTKWYHNWQIGNYYFRNWMISFNASRCLGLFSLCCNVFCFFVLSANLLSFFLRYSLFLFCFSCWRSVGALWFCLNIKIDIKKRVDHRTNNANSPLFNAIRNSIDPIKVLTSDESRKRRLRQPNKVNANQNELNTDLRQCLIISFN